MLGLGDFRATYLEKKVKKKGNAVAVPKDFFKNNMIGVIIFEAIIVILSVLFIYRAQTALTIRSYPAIITGITFSILIPVIATISYCLWWKKRKKEIDAAYYGTENGNIGNQCTVTYLLLASEIRRYSVEWVDFWRDVFRREPLTAEEKQKRTKSARQILQFFICEALAIALVFVAILPIRSAMTYVSHNMFYIEKVNAVDIGDSYETVEELLPDPYARDAGTQTWTYYDNNFKKLLEKNENFDPSDIQDWDDFEDAFNDAAELETTQFGYIEVHFERESGNSGTYIVSSVFFDPARQYRDGYEHREAESYEALDISVDEETDAVTVIYSATYEDGSFYKGKAAGTIERGSIASGRTITLSWRDYFGNACEAEYTIPAQS